MITVIEDGPTTVQVETAHLDVPDVPEAFRVADEQSANWVVRKVIEARQYAEHVKKWADGEIRRAEREEQFFMMRFEWQLRTWVLQQLEKLKGKRKSLNLPAGTVGFRSSTARLVLDDELKAIVWAKKELPSAIATVTKIKKSELDDYFSKNGEEPSGTHFEAAGKESFYVR